MFTNSKDNDNQNAINYSLSSNDINSDLNEIIIEKNKSKKNKNIIPFNRINNPFLINEIENVKNSGKLSKKIEGLNKAYWKFCGKNIIAIDNLYLSLEQNEKFGLLGYNGSGKTSIFKSITNEILYDSGKISLFGYNNKKDFNRINSKIRYCP